MTSSERHAQVKKIFLELCELTPEDRSGRLEEICEADPGLRSEVEQLLAFDGEGDPSDSGLDPVPFIGPYRLLQKIGEGGMGEVWEAEQQKPIRRRVALKLIKWGMDTKEVLARFESERQALALMNHPNIAKAFDAGSSDEGRPFFAMEFVKGVAITTYCDANRLDTRSRLELFRQVCDGVQHAHQKGVIHRDIKPSNILVAVEDGRPVPKIIDFGVAKATSQRLTERTLFTELGQWIGTPEYMSPEQAELTSLDVDTRSDVYSLGVVLYEILAGAQPFDSEELRTAGFDEMRRRIREEEPPRPSTRVSSLGHASKTAAERRRTDAQGLARTLRGDLDWIVMKALEKDRTRRYGSPSSMAADVGRYLRDEPVEASPPTASYKLRKFVSRHRIGVAAGVMVLLALVAGVAGTAVGFVKARNEAETARRVSELLVGVFGDLDPEAQLGQISSVSGMLDRGVERIQNGLTDQPLVRARLLSTVGNAYRNMGRFDEAMPLLVEALEIREEHLGGAHSDVADSCVSLGWLEYWGANYEAARGLFERAAGVYEQTLGPDHWAVASSLGFSGGASLRIGEYEVARASFERAMEVLRSGGLENDPIAVHTTWPYAAMLMDLGDYASAEELLEHALQLYEESYGPDHPLVGGLVAALGRCHLETVRLDEARSLFERAVLIQQQALGPDHHNLMFPLAQLGEIDRQQRYFDRAEEHYRRALEIGERTLGPEHPDLLWILGSYALLKANQGDIDGARDSLDQAMQIAEDKHGSKHLGVARTLELFGFHYYQQREYDEALRWYRRALAIREEIFGSGHPSTGWNHYDQACLLALSGDGDGALATLNRALHIGWANKRIFVDNDLDSLRDDPRFVAILDEVQERL